LIPHEDTAVKTQWPRYGNPASAYIRGTSHDFEEEGSFRQYINQFVDAAKRARDQKFLYVNMHPFFRIPVMLRQLSNVLIADIALALFERGLNPNMISMPALLIVFARFVQPETRPILASFQGANSHPVRQSLQRLSNGTSIVVNLVDRARHFGKINAVGLKSDLDYERLLANSTFAFVPRGDALFSYRLLKVMSFGAFPIILPDGRILPFDQTVQWQEFSLHVHAEAIPRIPYILSRLMPDDILARQEKTLAACQTHLSSLKKIVATMIREAETLCRPQVAS
jgi:hypothetical protein